MKLTVNIKTLPAKTFRKAVKYAEPVVAEQALKDTNPFVPALTGTFSKLAHTVGNEIIYTGDQAQYLYYGKVMVDQDNRHAVFMRGKDGDTARARYSTPRTRILFSRPICTHKHSLIGWRHRRKRTPTNGQRSRKELLQRR